MIHGVIPSVRMAARCLTAMLLIGALGLLSACASPSGTESVTGFDQLNLKPGDTGQCNSRPCRVFMQIPAGTGSYVVTGNEARIGVFPAGKNADLGSFWQSQAFQIKGMDAPKAYAYIPEEG